MERAAGILTFHIGRGVYDCKPSGSVSATCPRKRLRLVFAQRIALTEPLCSKVNFTGSTRVGSIIGSMCGKYIKPLVLELGGAAVFVVLEDADLEHAAKNAIYGSFCHSGQICMSTNNVLGDFAAIMLCSVLVLTLVNN